MARPGGLELPTFWFVARRSIQLSYGRTKQSLTQSNRYSHFLCDSNFDFRPAAAIKNFFDADAECLAVSTDFTYVPSLFAHSHGEERILVLTLRNFDPDSHDSSHHPPWTVWAQLAEHWGKLG